MTIRFSNAPSTFKVFPAGAYDFSIASVEQGTSKKGNPQLTVKLEIVGGPEDGSKMTEWYSLTDASFWKIGRLVEATGCPHTVEGQDAKGNPIVAFDEADLVGLYFTADLTIDEYEGKKRNRLNNERFCDNAPQDAEQPVAHVVQPTLPVVPMKPITTTSTMAARRPRTVAQS